MSAAAIVPNGFESEPTHLTWWQRTIVYECYPKSFQDTVGQGTGTLRGVIKRLDYLRALGVGAIWLTPVYASPQRDNGYDVADYRSIDPSYGTMADMDELIAEAHARGMRIVMDLVFNHTSEECAWFAESRSSQDNPRADWYIWRDGRTPGSPADGGTPPNRWGSIFGGPAWTYDEGRGQWYLHTFGSYQPDLNWENPQVREALYDVANFWADKGVGGFRVDAITYIKKPAGLPDVGTPDAQGLIPIHGATANTPGILDFLREFRSKVREGRDIFCVAEANGVPVEELSQWVGSSGVFDMIFEFSVMHVPMDAEERWYVHKDWQLTDVKRAIAASQETTRRDGWYPAFLENHDQPRSVSNFFPPEVATDPVRASLAAKALGCVLLTMRGTPFVYQGEELGYTNVAWDSIERYDDVSSKGQYAEALAAGLSEADALACVQRYSRDNARTPMQWDASANAGFSDVTPWLPVHDDYATQNVAVEDADASSVLNWYRRLAALRASRPALVAGTWEELLAESEQVFAFRRAFGDDVATTVVNWTGEVVTYDASLVAGQASLADSYGEAAMPGVLRPYEASVFGA